MTSKPWGSNVSCEDPCLNGSNFYDLKNIVLNELSVLRAKRNLEKIQEAKYIPLHPKETVKNIYLGNHYSLEFYRSLSDKKDLLAEAVAIGDGNVILTVIFLFIFQVI